MRPPTGRNAASPSLDRLEARSRRERAGGGGAGVQRVVPAARVQLDRGRRLRGAQLDPAAEVRELVASAHLRGMLEAEVSHAPPGEPPAPVAREFVVGVDHRDAAGTQRIEHRGVLARDLGDVLHEFLVLALRVVDERDGRARDRGEAGGLARMVHAQLDHRRAVGLAQIEQRQRQADVVVEIALGREHLRVAEVRAQDRRDHLLHRGLAVGAGDRDRAECRSDAPVRRQAAQARAACRRRRAAAGARASAVDFDSSSTMAAAAPRSLAASRKRCPSKRSPRSAMNRAPRESVRLSVDTGRKRRRRRDAFAPIAAEASRKLIIGSIPRAPARLRACRRREAAGRRSPGRSRGPFPRGA